MSYEFDQSKTSVIQQRYLGYHQALQDFGIKPDEGLEYTEEQQATMISSIDKFQAVLVTADYLAIKFIHKLKQEAIFMKRNCRSSVLMISVMQL